MIEPGTDRFNCRVCDCSPFERRVYRDDLKRWYCEKHRPPVQRQTAFLDIVRRKRTYEGVVEPQQSIPLSAGADVECPATMCPLIAKDGSPNANVYAGHCPEHDDIDRGGCPWWKLGCSTGLQHQLVRESVALSNNLRPSRVYDCPKAAVCSWQKAAVANGLALCPPRTALAQGVDPRVVNWT